MNWKGCVRKPLLHIQVNIPEHTSWVYENHMKPRFEPGNSRKQAPNHSTVISTLQQTFNILHGRPCCIFEITQKLQNVTVSTGFNWLRI